MSPVTMAQTSKSLAPLMLSTGDKVSETIFALQSMSSESISETVQDVTSSFYKTYRDSEAVMHWIEDVREDNVIVRRESNGGSDLFQVPFEREGNNSDVRFSPPDEWTKVRRAFVPMEVTASDDAGLAADAASLTSTDGEDAMDEAALRALLSIGEEDSIEEAIAALSAKAGTVESLDSKLKELTTQVETLNAEKAEVETKLTEGTGDSVKLTEQNAILEAEKKALSTELATLSDRLTAVEQDRNQKEGQERIDKAIEARKVLPSEVALSKVDGEEVVPAMRKLAFESGDTFDEIVAARSEYSLSLTIEEGAGDEGDAATDPKVEYWSKVRATIKKLMAEDPKQYSTYQLAQQESRKQVEDEFPQLAEQAKKAA